jgi:hypothetical protein
MSSRAYEDGADPLDLLDLDHIIATESLLVDLNDPLTGEAA